MKKNTKSVLVYFKPHIVPMFTSGIAIIESITLILTMFKYNDNAGEYISKNSVELIILYVLMLFLCIGVFIYEILSAIKDYRDYAGRVFAENDKLGIDGYLTRFIQSGESVAILSHDMSWISDDNMEMLQRKAQKKELLLLLPQKTEEVEELKRLGADVRYFGSILSDPAYALIRSRMTVINWNKAFPKLTYPIKRDGLHINNEVPAGEPANQLALDLIQLLIKISSEGEMNNSMIRMLEQLRKDCCFENAFDKLSSLNQQKIKTWFSKYQASGEFNISKALSLMLFLYNHENLDHYTSTEFLRIRDQIQEEFSISESDFLAMFIEFRKLIFG